MALKSVVGALGVSAALWLLPGCAPAGLLDVRLDGGVTIREELPSWSADKRAAFDLFRDRCSNCHDASQAFAVHFPPENWPVMVRKMARKPGAGIAPEEATRIAAFLRDLQARK